MDTDKAIERVSLLSLLKGIVSPVTKKTLKHGLTVVIQIIPHIPDPSKASPANPSS